MTHTRGFTYQDIIDEMAEVQKLNAELLEALKKIKNLSQEEAIRSIAHRAVFKAEGK